MIRRELFSYAVFFCLGIIIAFICFEKREYVLAAIIFVILFKGVDFLAGDGTFDRSYIEKFILVFVAGFLIFLFQFYRLNDYELFEKNNGDGSDFAAMTIEGKARNVRVKEDGISVDIDFEKGVFDERIRVSYYGDIEKLGDLTSLYGKDLRCAGKLRIPDEIENPKGFDYRLYLKSIGIKYVFSANNIEVLEGDLGRLENLYFSYKKSLIKKRNLFESYFKKDNEVQGVVKGILWGDKSAIEEDIKEEFNLNGTGHILAVSGLHIGFIFSLLKMLSRSRKTLLMYLFMVVVVLAYGEMTMFSPSTVRAIIVMVINLFSMHLKRPFDLLSSISAASFIILIYNPYQLFNSSFHMTMVAMVGISFLTVPLSYLVGDNLSVPLAVTLSVSPYTAYVFNRFNPITILINIPIIFIGSLIVPICFLQLCIITLLGSGIPIVNEMILLMCKLLIFVNDALYFDGGFSKLSLGYNVGFLLCFYGALLVLGSEWGRIKFIRKEYNLIKKALCFVLIFSVAFGVVYRNDFADDGIIFVSVGQGDCTHIREGRNDIFIDGGGNANTNVGKQTLLPYILKNGSADLDLALVTHLHMDHYKGLEELSAIFNIKRLGLPIQYKDVISRGEGDIIDMKSWENSELSFVKAGSKIITGEKSYIEPLWPAGSTLEKVKASDSENENNMAYMINYDKIKILVLGDMTGEDEVKMSNYYKGSDKLSCDVIRISHHGSGSSTTDELLAAAKPKISVISVGRRNMYGHPSDKVIKKLEDRGIQIFRTDTQGAIGLEIKNGKIRRVDTVKTR